MMDSDAMTRARAAGPSRSTERARAASEGGPSPLRATVFDCGPDTFAILSLPATAAPLPAALSDAEKEICGWILAGLSNGEVARRRGTAVRTVANQVASILRKLGARSRSELPMVLARPSGAGGATR